jgi:hypothetical protein
MGSAQIVMIFELLMMAAGAAHHYLVRSTLLCSSVTLDYLERFGYLKSLVISDAYHQNKVNIPGILF